MAVNRGGDFVGGVRETASRRPADLAFIWLRDGERDEVHLSFGELDRQAGCVAGELLERFAPGDRVLLVFESELSFISAFLGCLYAGMIAVPVAPPRRRQSPANLPAVMEDCRPAGCLTESRWLAAHQTWLHAGGLLDRLQWLDVDSFVTNGAVPSIATARDPHGVAYLQYTSGSTGRPRGVMVTHENLLRDQQMMAEAAGHGPQTRYVGWLPLFHDMGLVGIVLQSLYLGVPCVLLPAKYVIQKPLRWLEAISRYRATSTAAPNFAYDLCVRTIRPDQMAALDLSHWSAAISGAEPVRADTIERFSAAFHSCGFRPEAFFPCYGLAESTVFVTGPEHGQPPRIVNFRSDDLVKGRAEVIEDGTPGGRRLVGCGFPRQDQRVEIVDPDSRIRQPERRVGEIWVRGSAVGLGYWNRPDETKETFGALIADGVGPSLRTGDVGFVDDGQLFVVGRLKDVLIVRGSNHHPQDIEQTVQDASSVLRPGAGAAFSVDLAGEERLVVVQEVERTRRDDLDITEVLGDAREAVAAEHGLRLHALILIRPGTLPMTTSGKVRRAECRRQLQTGGLAVIAADYGQPDCRSH